MEYVIRCVMEYVILCVMEHVLYVMEYVILVCVMKYVLCMMEYVILVCVMEYVLCAMEYVIRCVMEFVGARHTGWAEKSYNSFPVSVRISSTSFLLSSLGHAPRDVCRRMPV